MDIKNNVDYRTYKYTMYNDTGHHPYDYTRYGILTKSMPKILFKGNPVLVTFLQFIDARLVVLFKTIDKLKHFKHYTY